MYHRPGTILCAINTVAHFTLIRTLIPILHKASKGRGSRGQNGELTAQLQGDPGSGSAGSWQQHS